jgi:hypothetical protein
MSDVVDTLFKDGSRHGTSYNVRAELYSSLSVIAMRFKRVWFHAFFAVFALTFEVRLIMLMYKALT